MNNNLKKSDLIFIPPCPSKIPNICRFSITLIDTIVASSILFLQPITIFFFKLTIIKNYMPCISEQAYLNSEIYPSYECFDFSGRAK